jgi:Met-10+ like-protein
MTLQKSMPVRMMLAVLRVFIPTQFRPSASITRLTMTKSNLRVQAGPFCGMQYVDQSYWSAYIPKLLGIYERELSIYIEEAVALPFQTVVDIGAAEGYYAVGLAMRMCDAKVVAFEMEPAAQELLVKLAKLNQVSSRVAVEGKCTSYNLSAVLNDSGRTLVICDAEGGEAFLLDPVRIPKLAKCHILVELHDHVLNGMSEEIRDRFAETHDITHILETKRDRSDFPYHNFFTRLLPTYVDWAVSEVRRCKIAWYWMRPRIADETSAPQTHHVFQMPEPDLI